MTVGSLIQASRPKTLPAAVVPVWLGGVLAWRLTGQFNWWLALCTLMGAIFIQIATNFFNDAIDSAKGADTDRRIGPQRVTASGQLSRKAVYGAAFTCLGLASVFGWFLFLERGWIMIAIGLPSFYLAYGYTGGPLPLAYRGLGEIFVILFFGLIAVGGTVFVQTGELTPGSVLLGLQVGMLSAVLIAINNIRDREEDASTGKKTLVVLLGRRNAVRMLTMLTILPYAIGRLWQFREIPKAVWIPLPVMLLGMIIVLRVRREKASPRYNKYLAMSALQLLLFALLFTVACFW